MAHDQRQAQAELREISDRQQQVLSASGRIPRWLMAGQLGLLGGLMLAIEVLENPWVILALAALFAVLQVALVVGWHRRQPAPAHPSQFSRGRAWLTAGVAVVIGAAVGVVASRLLDWLGTVGLIGALLLCAALVAATGVAHPRMLAWARRRHDEQPPAAGATHDGREGR